MLRSVLKRLTTWPMGVFSKNDRDVLYVFSLWYLTLCSLRKIVASCSTRHLLRLTRLTFSILSPRPLCTYPPQAVHSAAQHDIDRATHPSTDDIIQWCIRRLATG